MTKLKAKSPEATKTGKSKSLIYGASGVGKTWFSLAFPLPYYIDCEHGADLTHYKERLKAAGGAYLGPEDGSLDFQTVIEQMQALATEKHGYKTLIIDSITKLYQTCISNEAEKLGSKDVFGASKKPAIANMRRLVNWAMKLDMNIMFVAHETSEWGVDASTGQRQEVGKIPDIWDKLIYELDLTLKVEKRGASRVAIVRKSRLTGFPEGESFSLDYPEFSTRYGKDYIESKVEFIKLATEEQVAEVKRLLEIVKVDPEKIEKGFSKARVDAWEEMTDSQITVWLDYLNNAINPKAKKD